MVPPPLEELFGFEPKLNEVTGDWERRSLQTEDGYLIATEIIARSAIPWAATTGWIQRARAVTLRDYGFFQFRGRRWGTLPKQLHYFADAVAHVALHDLAEAIQTSNDLNAFFASGWIVDLRRDKDEEHNKSGRLWDQEKRVAAVLRAGKLNDQSTPNGIGINLFRELTDGSRNLSGRELKELFQRLPIPIPK